MKLGKTTKLTKFAGKLTSQREAVVGSAEDSPANTGSSWLVKGSANIAAEVESAKVASMKRFAPEFFLRDGESKLIRLRSSEPLCLFKQYSVKINGKWNRVTAPPVGERDLMREEGLKPSARIAYEVIDKEGYVDKKNVAHRNVARFWIVNMKLHEQLETIRRKKGGLTAFDLEVSRSGQKQKTTYTIMVEAPSPFPGIDRIPSIKNDFSKYYAPPSIAEQKTLMSGFSLEEQDRED